MYQIDGCEGHEVLTAATIVGGIQGYGGDSSWIVVIGRAFVGVDKITIFEFGDGMIVGARLAGDECSRAQGFGDATGGRELIARANGGHYRSYDQFPREFGERKEGGESSSVLFDGPDGSFDVADVGIGGCNVEKDGSKIVTNASEFHVGVNLCHRDTASAIKVNDGLEAFEHIVFVGFGFAFERFSSTE